MSIRRTGIIVDMHVYSKDGKPLTYYYRLLEKLPLSDILQCSHASETADEVGRNYQKETSHWLTYWREECPLDGVSQDFLKETPITVEFLASGSKFKDRVFDPPLNDVRNIYVDKITPVRNEGQP